jgi:hypothetical protein
MILCADVTDDTMLHFVCCVAVLCAVTDLHYVLSDWSFSALFCVATVCCVLLLLLLMILYCCILILHSSTMYSDAFNTILLI